jgi:hypothetical protein
MYERFFGKRKEIVKSYRKDRGDTVTSPEDGRNGLGKM